MNILEHCKQILSDDGYRVAWRPEMDEVLFEDASICGCVRTLASVGSLLNEWRAIQDSFLAQHLTVLQLNPVKASNAYLVLLTSQDCNAEMRGKLNLVEEDFYAMRKIARHAIDTNDSLRRALSPLLKVSYASVLSALAIESRLSSSIPDSVLSMLDKEYSAEQVADQIDRLS